EVEALGSPDAVEQLRGELGDPGREAAHHAGREGLADQAAQLAVLRRIHAYEIAAAEEREVALRRHDLAEVGREGGGIGEHALHVGVSEHLPDAVLVVMDRPGVALLPEPGEHGIEAGRGRLGRWCRGLHRTSLLRRPSHATLAATAGKAVFTRRPDDAASHVLSLSA